MSEIAIQVENLSKEYRISATQERYVTLRDRLAEAISWPLRRLLGKTPAKPPDTQPFWALRDVSFDVGAGEVVGIVGRNGAGKSTLLKVLSKITEPTGGRAILRGRVASLLEVGSGFHPELSGRDNIYMNGAILGMRKAEIDRKFDEIVAFAETGQFIDTAIKHYSSGMYMRLAFAVAAHLEAEILFVDEVLAVGDAEFQKKCLGKMQNIAQEGRTIIFVSHNLTAIATLCQKTLHLDAGRVVAYGPTNEVVSRYLIPETGGGIFNKKDFPKEELIILHDARVTQNGSPDMPFVTSLPVQVEMEYELKKAIVGFRVGADVLTHDGIVLWRTWDGDMTGAGAVRCPAGRYKTVCHMPADVFRPSRYVVSLLLAIHRTRWVSIGMIQQTIQFQNRHGVGWAYHDDEQHRAGVLLMGIPWTTTALTLSPTAPR
jgi:lipopolysaccharide transport system ATP-binding protein